MELIIDIVQLKGLSRHLYKTDKNLFTRIIKRFHCRTWKTFVLKFLLTYFIELILIISSDKDSVKHTMLGESRLKQNKARRSYDGPVVPPRLFPAKSKPGRVDYVLQLVQECERRYALEREFVLSSSTSREFIMHRSSARNLSEGKMNDLFFFNFPFTHSFWK